MAQARILVVDDSPLILKMVEQALSRAGYEVHTAGSAREALMVLDNQRFDLIIADVMMPEIDGYELCRLLRRRADTASLPILMLTAQDSLDAKIRGFEAGADDYMTKPFEPAELLMRVQVLLRRAGQTKTPAVASAKGRVLAPFSLRGGVGVSTVAANLAVALAQLWGQSTVLVDLSLTAGQSALMLNLSLRHTWANLAEIPPEELDGEVVESVLLPHTGGVYVLAAPLRPEEAERVTEAHVQRTLDLLRHRFHYIVLDLPHDFRDTTLAGLDTADIVLLLMAPELASIRAVAAALDAFAALEYPNEKIHLTLNWLFKRPGLPRQEIENTLKRNIRWVLPYLGEAAIAALNRGQPLALESPTHPARLLFEEMAFHLSKPEHRLQRPTAPTATWKRLAQRLRARRAKGSKAAK